jgi:uncharacterized membrane protein YhaH (DUF805 family)
MSYCMTCGKETQMISATCSNCGAQMVQIAVSGAPPRESAAKFWLKEWFSFSGRISRRSYWLGHELPMFGVVLISVILDRLLNAQGVIPAITLFLLVWPSVATQVKRAHDRGRSGWFLMLALLPIISIWPTIELGFLRGDAGANRFGPDPLAARSLDLARR